MNAPLVPIAIAFMLGIAAAGVLPSAAAVFVAAGVVGAGLALWRRTPQHLALTALLVAWMGLGMLWLHVWRTHPVAALQARLSDEPQAVQLHGVVSDDPSDLFSPNEFGTQTFALQVRHVRAANEWALLAGRLRVTLQDPRVPLSYGDEIVVEGEWSRVPAPGNPGQYDWAAALERQRIHGLLRVKPYDGLVILHRQRGSPWLAAVYGLRRRWERLLEETFAPQQAGLLRSLLLGERVALDEQLKDAFVETGTIHLLVISGFNVGLIAGLLELLFRVMGIPWRLRLVGLAISLGGYCILTGLQPPVARATLMAWVVLGAHALDRVISWSNTLAAAALFILWVNPTQLFDAGFQLSFGAVLSLLLFTARWGSWFERLLSWIGPPRIRRYLAVSLSTTTAVWVGLAPILAWYFHLVSPVSLLANLLLAPLMSALVAAGTTILLLGTVVEAAVRWGSGPLWLLLETTLRCVSWCHRLPGGYWHVGHPSPWFLVGYYALVGTSILRSRLRVSQPRLLICWVAAATVWLWSAVALRVRESRWLQVDLLDVGHGDCIVVRTPRGRTLLVDTGSQEAGRYRVVPYLRFLGVRQVDALVLTHTDEDHLGGAIPLLQQMRVKRLLTNGVRDDTMSSRLVHSLAEAQALPDTVLAAGLRLAGEPDLGIEVLHPPAGLVPGSAPKSNDNSIVLKLTKGSISVLLSGDVEEAGLPWLLRAKHSIASTVLKVPHHGSRLGWIGEQFFTMVRPKVALLSVGRAHHLPAQETLRALRQIGSTVYSTREDGAIQLRTDGIRLEIRTARSRKRVMLTPTQGLR